MLRQFICGTALLAILAIALCDIEPALGQESRAACRPYDPDPACRNNPPPRAVEPPCAGPPEACGGQRRDYGNRPPPPGAEPPPPPGAEPPPPPPLLEPVDPNRPLNPTPRHGRTEQDLPSAKQLVDWVFAGFHKKAATRYVKITRQLLYKHLENKEFDQLEAEKVYRALRTLDDELNYRRHYFSE